MNNLTRILLSVALLSLDACSPLVYGKVETPSVTDKESFTNIPGGGFDLAVSNLLPPVTFNIGDIFGFDLSSSEMKDSSIKLNGASLKISSPTNGTATFDKVTSASLKIATSSGPKEIAKFEARTGQTPAGSLSADKLQINFASTGDEELFSYLKNKTVQVTVSATGTAPGSTAWSADLTLDFKVAAQYNAL